MENPDNNIEIRTPMSWRFRLCYGIGHVMNDVCASMWFTYLLVFYHLVLGFDSVNAGAILLIGQVADALSTPFIGIQSDKDDNFWLCKYGRRKTWHLVGTICVLCSFPFIFSPCPGCRNAHIFAQMIYYGAFVVIFQFGWAAVQISHLALIPELTPNEHQRTQLTAVRYSFTVISNVLVYIVTWVSLKIGEDTDPSNQIGPNDAVNFQRVVYIGLAIGSVTSLIFHWGVKESNTDRNTNTTAIKRTHKSIFQFLGDAKLYQVAIVYMSTRLFVNLGQVYIPLYLHETLSRNAESLAVVPLLMFISSLSATFIVHPLNKVLGRLVAYATGALIGIGACVWIKFGSGIYYNEYEIYPVAILLGFGGSIMLVTSLGITADLIGHDTDTGAFVYGSMSFVDKLANGIAVILIQYLKCTTTCTDYYRDVLAFVCGGSAIIGILPLFTLKSLSSRYSSGISSAEASTSSNNSERRGNSINSLEPLID